MAKKRPGMMIYFADWDGIADLLTAEQFKRLFLALMHTSMGEEVDSLEDDKMLALTYRLLQDKLDRDVERYDEVCERRRAAANKRWGNRTAAALQQNEVQVNANDANACFAMQTMPTVNVTPTVTPTVNVNPTLSPLPLSADAQTPSGDATPEAETERKKPSAAEVLEYAQAAGYERVDSDMARRFIAAQAAKGWQDSDGRSIRNWRTWFDGWYARLRNAPMQTGKPAPTGMQYDMRTYTDAEMRALTGFMEGDDPNSG